MGVSLEKNVQTIHIFYNSNLIVNVDGTWGSYFVADVCQALLSGLVKELLYKNEYLARMCIYSITGISSIAFQVYLLEQMLPCVCVFSVFCVSFLIFCNCGNNVLGTPTIMSDA